MKTNRISHLFYEVEFLEALERTGAVRIESPSRRLVRVGDIGYEPPPPPDFDCAHNVAGVGTQRGCETPEDERRVVDVGPLCFAAGVGVLLWSLVGWIVGRWWR